MLSAGYKKRSSKKSASKKRSPTKSQITKSFGKHLIHESTYAASTSILRKAYGKYLKPLTLPLAKELVGQSVYSLTGQMYDIVESQQDKSKNVQKLKILGFGEESDFHKTYHKGDNLVLKQDGSTFEAYMSSRRKQFCTGSGCDYVYVFTN